MRERKKQTDRSKEIGTSKRRPCCDPPLVSVSLNHGHMHALSVHIYIHEMIATGYKPRTFHVGPVVSLLRHDLAPQCAHFKNIYPVDSRVKKMWDIIQPLKRRKSCNLQEHGSTWRTLYHTIWDLKS